MGHIDKGTYIGALFDTQTTEAIHRYLITNKIPNSLRPHKLHATILRSRKPCIGYTSVGSYSTPIVGTPNQLQIWNSSIKVNGDHTNCLVLTFQCPELLNRHIWLSTKHAVTHEFSEYEPHITLSYNCGDIDIKQLSPIGDIIDKIVVTEEYGTEFSDDIELCLSPHCIN